MNNTEECKVFCECGNIIGKYIEVYVGTRRQVWLMFGGSALQYGHGMCIKCRKEWHWAHTDKMMSDLIGKKST